MATIIGRLQLLQETFPPFFTLPQRAEAAAGEIIGGRRMWWRLLMRDEGRRAAVTRLTRLRQETTTGVDMHFSVHTGPLMNTNSQLAEDEGAATEEQLEKYESDPCGTQRQWDGVCGLDNEVVCMCVHVCESKGGV